MQHAPADHAVAYTRLGTHNALTSGEPLALHVEGLNKTFRSGRRTHQALKDVEIAVRQGEMVGLIGASGSGKSTLMRHCAGLVCCDAGTVHVAQCKIQDGSGIHRKVRKVRRKIGFIFQQFNLVGRLTLLKNVCLGMLGTLPLHRALLGWFTAEEKRLAMAALSRVGIAEMAGQRASTLSGGQQQRGAIARALVQGAEVLLADEPIASLDPQASRRVMECLTDLNRDGMTVVVCLHQVEFARRFCPRIVALRDGLVVYDGPSDKLDDAWLAELYGSEADDAGLYDRVQQRPHAPSPATAEALA